MRSREENMRGMMGESRGGGRDMMRSNSDLMGRGDMMRNEMMGNMQDMGRGMMSSGGRDMMRSQSEIMRPGQQDMMRPDIVDSRDSSFSREMMAREGMMSRESMMARENREMLNSREREAMMRPPVDMMRGGPAEMLRGEAPHMSREPPQSMMSRDSGMMGRDNMGNREQGMMGNRDPMMRSMSVSNGGSNNSFSGMGGGGGQGGMGVGGGGDNGFNRSMSYHGNSASPPLGGDAGLKIGTWNEGRGSDGGGAGRGGGGTGGFPAVSNFEIGTFNMNDPGSRSFGNGYSGGMGGGPGTQSNNGPIQPGMGIGETGIIEKLLHSYGFIQCCDRQARLFFHFSQFDGNT